MNSKMVRQLLQRPSMDFSLGGVPRSMMRISTLISLE
jgi:hypothetical protein